MERSAGKIPPALADNQLISLRQLAQIANYSEVQMRRLVKSGKTPKPVNLNAKKLGFRVSDVADWLAGKA